MGYYVNPPRESKEQFLKTKGVAVPRTFKWADTPKGSLPVILVNNGPFTAAAICYSEAEFNEFANVNDRRPKEFYVVSAAALKTLGDRHIDQLLERLNLVAA